MNSLQPRDYAQVPIIVLCPMSGKYCTVCWTSVTVATSLNYLIYMYIVYLYVQWNLSVPPHT